MINHDRLTVFYNKVFETPLHILSERFEGIIGRIYSNILDRGDVAVDVGAHIGRHTIPMGRIVGKEGKVFAFEPIPEIEETLRKNIDANDLFGIVIPHNMAVSNFNGEAEFIVIEDAPGLSGLKQRQYYHQHKQRKINIRVEKLDSMIPKSLQIKFMKIDAEGGDFDVLRGAANILKTHRPVVTFECGAVQERHSESYGFSREDFTTFFETVEYHLFSILGLRYNPKIWPEKTPWYLIGIPAEHSENLYEIVQLSIIENFFLQAGQMSEELVQKEERLLEKDKEIQSLQRIIVQKDSAVINKEKQLLSKTQEFKKIKESFSFKTGKAILSPVRLARKLLARGNKGFS